MLAWVKIVSWGTRQLVSLCMSGSLTKNRENAQHVLPPEQKMFRDQTEPTLFRAGTVSVRSLFILSIVYVDVQLWSDQGPENWKFSSVCFHRVWNGTCWLFAVMLMKPEVTRSRQSVFSRSHGHGLCPQGQEVLAFAKCHSHTLQYQVCTMTTFGQINTKNTH